LKSTDFDLKSTDSELKSTDSILKSMDSIMESTDYNEKPVPGGSGLRQGGLKGNAEE
jgi:hypothetical protein